MKKKVTLALAALLAVPVIASAQAYVGASVGSNTYKLSFEDASTSQSETGGKVYGGYNFTPNLGVEVGYANLGKWSESDGIDTVSTKTQSLYLAAVGTVPLAAGFSVQGKLGVARHSTKVTLNELSDTVDRVTPLIGIGATYAFTPNVLGVLEFEHYGKVASESGLDLEAQMVSAGIRVKF
jgi:OOP family OmpA-OmpF porin